MDYNTFIRVMVIPLESKSFEELKYFLINNKYLNFSFVKFEEISKEILADKLKDYFEKVEFNTGKPFENHLKRYYSNLDSLVGSRVVKAPQQKKKDAAPIVVPRARKYYDKAIQIKKQEVTKENLFDYTRLMMCLYVAIIKSENNVIKDFDYSADCINPLEILNTIKNEQDNHVLFGKGVAKMKKLNTTDIYSSDGCTLVIAAILLYKIVDEKI